MRAGTDLPPLPIRLKAVMAELRLSMRDLAKCTSMSASAMCAIVNRGAWPVRSRRAELEKSIRAACTKAGASKAQIASLFLPMEIPTTPARSIPKSPSPSSQPNPQENPDMQPDKQSLSREAQRAFEMFLNPFDGEVTTAQEMFTNTDFRYCQEACWQAANHGRFVAVIGESGAGKTTLLADLAERIKNEHKPVVLIKPAILGMEQTDKKGKAIKVSGIMDAAIYTLDPLGTPRNTMEAKARQLQHLLEDSVKAGNSHLLVIEEAHDLPVTTLKHLKRLHEMRMGRKPLLGILLLGQTELRTLLNTKRHDVREVVQRCEVVDLLPLDGDLKGYLALRLQRANKKLADIMDEAAIDAIRMRLTVNSQARPGERAEVISLVYPLAVNNFVTAAMNTAASLGVPRITRDVVMGV